MKLAAMVLVLSACEASDRSDYVDAATLEDLRTPVPCEADSSVTCDAACAALPLPEHGGFACHASAPTDNGGTFRWDCQAELIVDYGNGIRGCCGRVNGPGGSQAGPRVYLVVCE